MGYIIFKPIFSTIWCIYFRNSSIQAIYYYYFFCMSMISMNIKKVFWLSSTLLSFYLRVKSQTWVAGTGFIQFISKTFLFLSPWNIISLTWERPPGLVLINLLLKLLKQKKVICCQLKLLVMESSRHRVTARMIAYFSAIYFNSLCTQAIVRPACKSRESSFSVISLMEAVRWSYQS